MASYQELRSLFTDSDLMEKVEVAVIIAANSLATGTPSTADKVWIAKAFSNPNSEAKKVLMAVLAENASASLSQIKSATDATLQTKVDGIIFILVDANAGI